MFGSLVPRSFLSLLVWGWIVSAIAIVGGMYLIDWIRSFRKKRETLYVGIDIAQDGAGLALWKRHRDGKMEMVEFHHVKLKARPYDWQKESDGKAEGKGTPVEPNAGQADAVYRAAWEESAALEGLEVEPGSSGPESLEE
jgi:hypothetical protein